MVLSLRFGAVAAAVAQAISSTAAQPSFFSPRDFLAKRDCSLPAMFSVKEFKTWEPAGTDKEKMDVSFSFEDTKTGIATDCYQNSTSEKIVPVEGLATRYACDNGLVEFIWKRTAGAPNGTLTMIEATCPEDNPDVPKEASGSVIVQMACTKTPTGSSLGEGEQCFGISNAVTGQYFSFQPRPKPPNSSGYRRRFSF